MKHVVQKALVLTASTAIAVTGMAGASATGVASHASPTHGDITVEQYNVLLQNFTPEEIVELDAISSPTDIQELVGIIKDPSSLAVNESSAIPRISTYAAPNGCSYSPDRWGRANFKPACNSHDRCYSSSSTRDRKTCDTIFYGALLGECKRAYPNEAVRRNACNGVASAYFGAVRSAGGSHYKGKGKNN